MHFQTIAPTLFMLNHKVSVKEVTFLNVFVN